MTTQDLANRYHELAQQGNFQAIRDEFFHTDAVSIEPEHTQNVPGLNSVQGLEAINEKGKVFNEMVEEMHGGWSKEPQVVGNFFTVPMGMDIKMKGQPRMQMEEIALYEVKEGKIVKEQFFY
ncbi:MAG: SnoaL-like domain-containing protein [Bacteroidota bacterium]|nr:SnoaL-like domain-containing protein [Bacteroidota bacterium]